MQPRTVDWVGAPRQVLRQRGAEDETLLKACRKLGVREPRLPELPFRIRSCICDLFSLAGVADGGAVGSFNEMSVARLPP